MAMLKSPELVEALKGNPWQVDMSAAPCASPTSCLCACLCPCCTVYSQRTDILSIAGEPYYPCGGACICCGSCKCCSCLANPVDPSMIPVCLGAEVCCCCPTAVKVNRYLIQTRFGKENTPTDDCIIQFAACLQAVAACCQCFVTLWNCYSDMCGKESDKCDEQCCRDCANAITCLSECVNLTVFGCMLTQQKIEVDYVKANGYKPFAPRIMNLLPPEQQAMISSEVGYMAAP